MLGGNVQLWSESVWNECVICVDDGIYDTFHTENFIRMPADAVTEACLDFVTYAATMSEDTEAEEFGVMQDSDVQNAVFCRVHTFS